MDELALLLNSAAAGAVVGEFILGKRLGNQALAWGAALALAPALLDGVVGLVLPTSARLAFTAGASHSLVAAGIAAASLPRWLTPRWKKSKLSRQRITYFVSLGWLVGPLVACLSHPGVQLAWPLPSPRLSAELLGRGDAMPGLLLAGFVIAAALLRTKKSQPQRRRRLWWGIGLALGYLAICLAAKLRVAAAMNTDLARRSVVPVRLATAPISWNPLLWRVLADFGDDAWLSQRSALEWPSTPIRWTVLPRARAAQERFAEAKEIRRLVAWTDGWWICRANTTGLWLADLRGGEYRVWGERQGMVDIRFSQAWHYEPAATGDPLHAIRPETPATGDFVKRLARRTLGSDPSWHGLPRLAGVPGALPEILSTQD